MANGFDPHAQTWPDYGNYGDNGDFSDPWFGFGSYEDYIASLGENLGAYSPEPQPDPWTPPSWQPDPTPSWMPEPWQPEPAWNGEQAYNPEPVVIMDAPSDQPPQNDFTVPPIDMPVNYDPFVVGPNDGDTQVNNPDITFGDPIMNIPGSDDPTVIGDWGAYPNGQEGVYDHTPPEGSPGIDHPDTDLLGPSNPTVYPGGQGGLLGTGLDIGLPGLISIGGLLGAGGGLLGLGGDMGGGGGGSSDSNPTVTLPPGWPASDGPAMETSNNPNPGMAEENPPSITVPPVFSNGGAESQPTMQTSPVATPQEPQRNPVSITIPPISGVDQTPNRPTENPNTPVTIPPIVGVPPANDLPPETHNPVTIPPIVGPVTPTTPTTPTTPNNPVTIPVQTTPTMPTQTLPLDRNYYREGNQSSQDLSALLPGIYGNYANQSGQYGQADIGNYGALLQALGGYNGQLTGLANQQTAASNSALRQGNQQDVNSLGAGALGTLRSLNPNQYGALDQAQAGAGQGQSQLQMMLEQQAKDQLGLGGSLSQEDTRNAQQSAREAWSARGLVNSNGAIGAEILNRDSLSRQRMQERQQFAQGVSQQGFQQQQGLYGNVLQNASLQSQNRFDPYSTILGANSGNVGLNQNLFQNGVGFSSGAYGNQNVNSLVNPFNPYSQDVYNSNYNAGNARYISAGNNAAAMSGAQDAASGQLANSFLRLIGSIYGAS